MTLQDIITETRQICQQTNPNNSAASDSVITGWANACTLQLCSSINTLPKTSVAGIVSAATITLPTNLLKMDYVSIEATLGNHNVLTTIDFTNFVRTTPGWQDQPVNRPSMLVRMDDLNWMLWPNPDATWTGKAMTIYGSVVPTPITSTSESPAVSVALHPAYPHYCAWKFFLLLNNPERAGAEYAAYDALRKLNQQTATSTRGSLQSFNIRGM